MLPQGLPVKGIGVDLVSLPRVAKVWQRWGKRFETRVYTQEELFFCLSKKSSLPALAARFAAKEAVMKALGIGIGGCTWQEIEVGREEGGRPTVVLRGRAQARAQLWGARAVMLSLAHTSEYAIAVAVVI